MKLLSMSMLLFSR